MGNFHQPVPSFCESLSSDVKLQGVGDSVSLTPSMHYTKVRGSSDQIWLAFLTKLTSG